MDKKKYSALTIILIIVISIRFFAQALSAFWGTGLIEVLIYLALAGAYLAAFIGVLQKAKWGAIVVIAIAAVDLIAAIFVGGATGFGAAFLDIIFIVLGYFEYRSLTTTSRKPAKRKK